MKLNYRANSRLEKFGLQVYRTLAKGFPQTYYTGGTVRDLLLRRKITDIDLTTRAQPEEVIRLLSKQGVGYHTEHRKFGVITTVAGDLRVQIATFRQDLAGRSRYPKVRFVMTPKADSQRRDFTVNAFYYRPDKGLLLDFHHGLTDLRKKQLRFIGDPAKRIKDDPLRIVRALRFQKQLKFKLESTARESIEKYFPLLKKLTHTKIEAEILKLRSLQQQKSLRKIINRLALDEK